MKIVTPHEAFSDSRGKLIEVIKSNSWKQMNYSLTKKGCVRGNHYHKKIEELFYILKGEIKLDILNIKTNEKKTHTITEGKYFIVEPYDLHTLTALTDVELIVLYSEVFDEKNPDLFRLDGGQQI